MTTETPQDTLHPLAEILDSLDTDRDRAQFVNRLQRLENSARLADAVADALDQHDGPAVIVALDRGDDRGDLPPVVSVPWTTNRAGDTLSSTLWIDARDTVRGIVAADDSDGIAVMFGDSLPRLAPGKGSTSTRAKILAAGAPSGTRAKLTQHAADKNGRTKFVLSVEEDTGTGTRGRSAAATL